MMQATIEQGLLARALAVAGRAVSTRSSLPVLANVMLAADGNTLTVTGTNLEMAVSCAVRADVTEPGELTAPAKLLTDWVTHVLPGPVELGVDKAKLTLKCGRSQSRMNTIDATAFPLIPVAAAEASMDLSAEQFVRLVERSAYAAAAQDGRASLTGILTTADGDYLTMVATDGYRLAVAQEQAKGQPAQALIPARAMLEAARIAKGAADVTLGFEPGRVSLAIRTETETTLIVTQLIDAKYPDWTAIVPKHHTSSAGIDAREFARLLKLAKLFAREDAAKNRVVFRLLPDAVSLAAESGERGSNESEMSATLDGNPLEFALSGEYTTQAVDAAGVERLVIEGTLPNRPIVLRIPDSDSYTAVIMPMAREGAGTQ